MTDSTTGNEIDPEGVNHPAHGRTHRRRHRGDAVSEHTAEKDARCPSMPPGMHPVMQTLIGAQYHRCRKRADHQPPCVNNDGLTWGYVFPPGSTADQEADA